MLENKLTIYVFIEIMYKIIVQINEDFLDEM